MSFQCIFKQIIFLDTLIKVMKVRNSFTAMLPLTVFKMDLGTQNPRQNVFFCPAKHS